MGREEERLTEIDKLKKIITPLISHYYCEDNWYSCPKAQDGCADESRGDECTCGQDKKVTIIAVTLVDNGVGSKDRFYGFTVSGQKEIPQVEPIDYKEENNV